MLYPFSIHIDECTSETGIEVFSIIVIYFDRSLGKSVIQNYKAVSILKGDAESMASIIVKQLQEDEIPIENLVADLSDSAMCLINIPCLKFPDQTWGGWFYVCSCLRLIAYSPTGRTSRGRSGW